jgi:hypothetical protein
MDEAVLEEPEISQETGESGEISESTPAVAEATEDAYSPKAAREYSQWLKGLKEASPDNAKFVRMAKDAFSHNFALNQMDKKGLDGVRERYALLDSVIHNDPERGELKGTEAIAAIQDTLREYADIDERIARGDATAIDAFDDAMKAGIVKMAPAILDMARQTDHEVYAAAVLPHFVEQLKSSDLVRNYNGLVDVLNEQMPNWLPEDKKQAWQADKMQRVLGLAGGMGNWLNAQADKVKGFTPGEAKLNGKSAFDQREQQFNQREQDHHWNTNIGPKLDAHASTRFTELFRPFATRLKLDIPTTNALKMEFSKRVSGEVAKDKGYMDQLKRYRAMKNPDPATVTNFGKVNFDKHAKTTLEALVKERYNPFLSGKPGPKPGSTPSKGPSPSIGVQTVSVRPAEGTYDPRGRTEDDIYKDIFRLKNGKVVRYARN